MSEKELQELLRVIEEVTAENSTSPEKARAFLQKGGFIDEKGELTEPYR